jgi:hypothetical protein
MAVAALILAGTLAMATPDNRSGCTPKFEKQTMVQMVVMFPLRLPSVSWTHSIFSMTRVTLTRTVQIPCGAATAAATGSTVPSGRLFYLLAKRANKSSLLIPSERRKYACHIVIYLAREAYIDRTIGIQILCQKDDA